MNIMSGSYEREYQCLGLRSGTMTLTSHAHFACDRLISPQGNLTDIATEKDLCLHSACIKAQGTIDLTYAQDAMKTLMLARR